MKLEEELGKILIKYNLTVATAESCTGGLISSKLTDVSGSSSYVKLNFVTYSNESKQKILGVRKETLEKYGAVSEECAHEMAEGLKNITNADLVICTTGIAGPTGGTPEKPVGLMYTSVLYKGIVTVKKVLLKEVKNRIDVKENFAREALKLALSVVSENRIA